MLILNDRKPIEVPQIYRGKQLDMWMQDGVLCAAYRCKEVNLRVAMEATEERIAFTNNINYPVIADYRNVEITSREARKYFASQRPAQYIDAMAVIITSLAGAFILNFFVKIDRPKFPLKAFNNFHSAHDWASTFKPVTVK